MKTLEEIPWNNHFCSVYSNVSIFPFIPASFTITCCFCSFFRKGKLEANRLLQIFLMDYRDLMAWMTDLAMRISSGEPAKNVREAEALLELHMERKVPNVQMRSFMLFYCGHLFPVVLTNGYGTLLFVSQRFFRRLVKVVYQGANC